MNAKKITSLVLAAVMAAGTTVTAFAEIDVSNPGKGLDADRPLAFEDENVYVDRDGILVKNPDEYRPGDTIYIRLSEYTADKSKGEKDSKIEDEKERMNVYADWKVGKDAVEDIDIVYDKGEFYDPSISNGAGYIYAVDFSKLGLEDINIYVDGSKVKTVAEFKAEMAEDSTEIEKLVETRYEVTGGYIVNNKYYKTADKAMADPAMSGYTKDSGYAIYDGQAFASSDVAEYLEAHGFEKVTEENAYWDVNGAWGTGYGDAATSGTTGMISPAAGNNGYVGYVNGSLKFVNVGVLTTLSALPSDLKDYVIGDAYVKNGEAYTAEGALAQENIVSVTTAYDMNGTVFTTLEDAVKYAIADISAVDSKNATLTGEDTGYTYWVKIDTVEDDTTKVVDLAGILYVGRTRNKAEDADNAFHLDAPLSNRVNDSTNYVTVDDEYTFKPDSRSVVKFDKDADDVVLYFGENEDAWFEVDARGQSALNLEFTFDFNREIADLFPKANIDFLTFTSEPSFNRTGTLYIVADADSFIYEVTENGVKEIANAEYDEDEEAWVIRTRKLAAYAISDRELDTSITLDGEDNTSSSNTSNNGGKDNPDTGR